MREIFLVNGGISFVDDSDFEWLNSWEWRRIGTNRNEYAYRNEDGRSVLMHRQIVGASPEHEVDHINGKGLDNQRHNLRECFQFQNAFNRKTYVTNKSGYKGVYWDKGNQVWRAKIQYRGKGIHIGCFKTPIEAAIAYNNTATELFGEFAKLNVI